MSILTLDMGTSSCRVMLWNESGRKLLAQVPYSMQTSDDGGVFMDADALVSHVAACFDKAILQIPSSAAPLRAVGVTTFLHSVLGIDAQGVPVTPILNWSDTRAAETCNALRQNLDVAAIHARTGCILHPSYYPAKIVWMRETSPDFYDRVARWISPAEYLNMHLFGLSIGEIRASVSIASGTGLYHHQTGDWDTELLQNIGITAGSLSPICNLDETVSGLKSDYASRWDILKNIPFVPATGDAACSNIGSDCNSPDKFAINLGTSGAIRAVTRQREIEVPFGLWHYRVDRDRSLVGTAFSDGGHLMDWLTDTLKLPPHEELLARLETMTPCLHGLTFLPFLAGERGLNWNPTTRGAILGLTMDTDSIEIVRAAMESVALQFAGAVKRLRVVFPNTETIVASGGAFTHFPLWGQMIADAVDLPVNMSSEAEATSRGAAILASEVLGNTSHSLASATIAHTYQPNAHAHARYSDAWDKMNENYHRLT